MHKLNLLTLMEKIAFIRRCLEELESYIKIYSKPETEATSIREIIDNELEILQQQHDILVKSYNKEQAARIALSEKVALMEEIVTAVHQAMHQWMRTTPASCGLSLGWWINEKQGQRLKDAVAKFDEFAKNHN